VIVALEYHRLFTGDIAMALATIEDRIVAVLRTQTGVHLCDECLALEVGATLAEAQAAVAGLDRDVNFAVVQGGCASCLRHKVVVCAVRLARAG
jgi:hypothetical protein